MSRRDKGIATQHAFNHSTVLQFLLFMDPQEYLLL
jgi:hypothetical protein